MYGARTWAFPCPPPPYAMHRLNTEAQHFNDIKCIELPTILAHGMSDLAAGVYDAGELGEYCK